MTWPKQLHPAMGGKRFISNYTVIGSSAEDKARLTMSLFLVGIFNFCSIQPTPLGSVNEYLSASVIEPGAL